MALARFERLLKDTMGLDVASVGAATIEHAVRERQRACGLDDARGYWERVQESGDELQRLIEAVVVSETWFFRDREAFAALSAVIQEWLRANPSGTLRLLSLPCSTGEEPYSMAMAALDAGVPMNRFRIDALDISARVLAHGERGVYGKSSFRGDGLEFRDRHFSQAAGGHQVAGAVRRHVRFLRGNVFASVFLPGDETYDVIFCRNMLIYFDRPAQAQVISILGRLLAPTGLLFVGASETGALLHSGFVSAKLPMAFAFRKSAAQPPQPCLENARAVAHSAPMRPAPAPRPAIRAARAPEPATTLAQPPADDRSRAGRDDLDEAGRLADRGRFVEAARRCEEHMRRYGPSADALYLLGLVRDASGNHRDAGGYYRKALYLDPDHREALAHLALLLDDQGRPADAERLRNRIKRLEAPRQA